MAKETGLAWTALSVDDESGSAQDIREDIKSLSFATPVNMLEVTGIDKSAMERLAGLRDFTISMNGTFDDDTSNSVFDVFKNIGVLAQRTTLITVSGNSLPNEVLYSTANWERADDGAFNFSSEGSLADGTVPTWA